MIKRKIVIDTGSSPTPDFIQQYDLDLIGIKIIMDRMIYIDGVGITHEQFYERIQKAREFSTEPPVVSEVVKKYKAIKSQEYDELVAIHFSEKMTKLVETSRNAAGMVRGINSHIIETGSVSAGSRIITERIIELLHSGKTPEEVKALLPEIKASTFMQFSVSTLKYLVKNGRIGKAQGLVGTLLNLKPILGIQDGVIAPIAKVRGMNKVFEVMADNAAAFIDKRPYNVRVFMNYGLERNKEWMEEAYKILEARFNAQGTRIKSVKRGRVWPTVACHSGPEGFAIAVYGEEKPITTN